MNGKADLRNWSGITPSFAACENVQLPDVNLKQAQSAQVYAVRASTDLVQWMDIALATDLGNGVFSFADTGSYARRFYRILSP